MLKKQSEIERYARAEKHTPERIPLIAWIGSYPAHVK